MQTEFLIRGFLIGLSVAVPVGPIGLLCMRRTISDGKLKGLVTGLGAAVGDGTYGGVAAFGLSVVSEFLIRYQLWFRLIGGVFLVYLGLKTFRARPVEKTRIDGEGDTLSVFVSSFFLTLTNPLTILMFTAIFAGFGVAPTGFIEAGAVTLCVFLGSASWWIVLTLIVGFVSSFFNTQILRIINIVSGLLITGFGLYSMIMALIG